MSLRARLVPILLVAALGVGPAAPAALAAPPASAPGDVLPGELLVKWSPQATPAARADERARHGLEASGRPTVAGYEQVRIDAGRDPRVVAAELRSRGAVEAAQPNFVYQPEATASSTELSRLWGFSQTNDVDLDVPEAWELQAGSSSVVVAVVDTGIQVSHPDLSANMWVNPGEIADNGKDDDGNGKVDDVHGWDFVSGDATVYDGTTDAHGTHIAGTIAATAGNGSGVAGIAPGVRIMALKVLDQQGKGSSSKAIEAIAYAKAKGARVINASWGYAGTGDKALNDAIATSNAVFVAAAGNAGTDNDTTPFVPANLPAPNIVSVAAVSSDGSLASWSNFGDSTVDVAAPGAGIYSTVPDGYGYMSGTSMAAPHVAGVAALLLSAAPAATVSDLVGLLKGAAVASPLSSLTTKTITGGMPKASAALAKLSTPTTEPTVPASPVWPDGAAITASSISSTGFAVSWTAAGDDVAVTGYDVTVGSQPAVTVTTTRLVVSSLAASTSYPVSVVARDADGNTSAPIATTVTTAAAPSTGGGGGSTGPVAEEPVAEEPVAEEPVPGKPVAEEPVAEEPVAEEPVAEEPVADEAPATHDGTVARNLELACPTIVSAGWTDVSETSPHADGIDCATSWEVFLGGAGATFSPGTRLSRAQLASVLARAIEQATGTTLAAGTDRFGDDEGSVHEAAINALAALEIVGGIDADTYAPASPVTRAQFASMLARTYRHLVGTLPAGTDAFTDDQANPHEPSIDALAALGVVTGDGQGSYLPAGVLTRAQSATMVARLIDGLVEAGAAG